MNRKIKVLGLALVAVLAVSAVTAVGAQAKIGQFTAGSYPATLAGTQEGINVFAIQGQKVECSTVTYSGTLSGPSTQIEIAPTYSNCTAFGFLNATMDMNGCKFLLTQEKTVPGPYGGLIHIKCPIGQTITFTAGGCVLHIPTQTPTAGMVDYNNLHPKITGTWTIQGIHSSVTSAFPCTMTTNPTDVTGSITGSFVIEQTNGAKTIDIG